MSEKSQMKILPRDPRHLEKSTKGNFRALFSSFWMSLGYVRPPSDISVDAYWGSLEGYAESIIMDMLDEFLTLRKVTRCPAVGEMMDLCGEIFHRKLRVWNDHQRTVKREKEEESPIDPEMRKYKNAVRDAVIKIMKKKYDPDKISETVHTIARQYGRPVLREWLPIRKDGTN